jgi:hypothetical protein
MSMTVVYASATGHVVGVRTGAGIGTAAPAVADAVADMVGQGLPLHRRLSDNTVADLVLPAGSLGAATVDDTPDALLDPLTFEVQRDPAGGAPKPALRRLAGWGETDPVTLTPTSVTVNVGNPVAASTPVIVVLSGGSPQLLTGEVAEGESKRTFDVRLDPGTYGVLLLVAGRHGRLDRELVP